MPEAVVTSLMPVQGSTSWLTTAVFTQPALVLPVKVYVAVIVGETTMLDVVAPPGIQV
jgi:hypothetical protein